MKKDLEDFKSQCDIVNVVSHYVVLEKAGSSYRGLCPFHDEKTPSFYVNPQKGFFHCFGCGASGDVIEFVKKIENLTFVEAVEKVSELCGIDSPLISSDSEFSRYVLLMEKIAKSYHEMLFEQKTALLYLLNERGLDRENIKKLELGYAPINSDIISSNASKMNMNTEYLLKYGLASRGSDGRIHEFFRDRIIFPIKNPSGKIVAFGGRVIDTGEPKYMNSAENKYFSKSKILYLFDRAKKKIKEVNFAIVCEGYMDAIAFHKNGFENACAVLGVNLTKDHIKLIKELTKNLLLVLDSDRAGISAMEKLGKVLVNEDLNVKVLTFSDAKDPDEYFKVHDRMSFEEVIKNSLDYWDFYVRMAMGETVDKLKAVRRFAESVKWVDSAILKAELIQRVSKILMIDEKEIMYELGTSSLENNSNNKSSMNVKTRRLDFDDYIIYMLFLNENVKLNVTEKIDSSYLSPFAKKIFEMVSDKNYSPQEVLKNLNKEEGEKFFQIITSDLNIDDVDTTLKVAMNKIKGRKIRSDLSMLEMEMMSTKDPERKIALKKKIMSLYAMLKGK